MFKIISYRGRRRIRHKNFHTLEAALEAAKAESERGRRVELCDMETTRLLAGEALHPNVGMRRGHCG